MLESALGSLVEDDAEPAKADRPVSASLMRDFGDYELLEEIGRGGQGVVYRARQKSLNRIVALKVIALGHFASTPHLKRFRQEAEAAARLEHPQIVPIYEIGEQDGSCYFSMKFIEGGQLDEKLKRGPMPLRRTAELVAKLARTVQFAHEHGILHRDLKPGNILLDHRGEPHLTDFGLARLAENESTVTKTSDVLGTPSYMAPEQARGDTKMLGAGADIYSLGAVLYHVLTNEPPFAANTTYETIRRVLEEEPPDPRVRNAKVDADLATICLKCLEKEPVQRYPSALALAEDLERWLRREPVRARPAGPVIHAAKFIRRNQTAVAVATAVVVMAVLAWVTIRTARSRFPISSGIAVLPFQNLGDQADEFFADGIQDDLLAKLANIGDLKVISRNSMMSYRGRQDVGQVARSLNVSHVLEGSVQRDGERMRIEAKLIDARTGLPIWSDRYDRSPSEILSSDGEIAVKVAQRLGVNLSGADREQLAKPMTGDLTAFDLYSRARDLFLTAGGSNSGKQEMIEATSLLSQAIARDPAFFEAYCQLAWVHGQLYILGHDHTPQRLSLAEAAVDAAFRLRPNAGEARIARAQNLYRGHLDYAGALAQLDLAAKTVPNDPRLFELRGYVLRRMGKYEEGLRELRRAVELDPRNVTVLGQISLFYGNLRRFAEDQAVCDRILAIDPNNVDAISGRAGSSCLPQGRYQTVARSDRIDPLDQSLDTNCGNQSPGRRALYTNVTSHGRNRL